MKTAVCSPYNTKFMEKTLEKYFLLSSKKPDRRQPTTHKVRPSTRASKPSFIFTFGGDGTILEAEQKWPGVPKVPLQKSLICAKCLSYSIEDLDKICMAISQKKYKIKEYEKIETKIRNKKFVALNDIVLRNIDQRKALRFAVNNKHFIGDGFVASTAYGSTAYFQSLGNRPFAAGAKLALNNCMPKHAPLPLPAKIKILRESALLSADNFALVKLKKGDSFTIKKSKQKARFVVIK